MTRNAGTSPLKLPKARMSWDKFDSLPHDVRDVLNNAAFKYVVTKPFPGCAAEIRRIDALAVARAYEMREGLDELKELGL